jgi:hypothetical protein
MSKQKPPPERSTDKVTFIIGSEVVAELRAASSEVPPKHFGTTLSAMVERSVAAELGKLRKKWNDGKPFKSDAAPRKGRPPKR